MIVTKVVVVVVVHVRNKGSVVVVAVMMMVCWWRMQWNGDCSNGDIIDGAVEGWRPR